MTNFIKAASGNQEKLGLTDEDIAQLKSNHATWQAAHVAAGEVRREVERTDAELAVVEQRRGFVQSAFKVSEPNGRGNPTIPR